MSQPVSWVPTVRDVLGPGSPLSRSLPGYEERPGQLAMAEAVEAALAQNRPLFVEAGTGTGKTLAYLVPAILSGKRVVVSTATKALQEQIFTKDLPLVTRVLGEHGITVQAAVMKGLGNYVCRRRYEELRQGGGGSPAVRRHLPILEAWVAEGESGDRSELAALPEDAEIWREVQSGSDTRIGATCTYYESCFVTLMRREAEAAQIVLVNHHLFLADLALRTGRGGEYASAIPNYDAVLFDEAHQLEDIATDFFGTRISSAKVEALLRDAHRTFVAAGLLDEALGTGPARALLVGGEDASRALFAALAQRMKLPPPSLTLGSAASSPAESRRPLTSEDWTDDVNGARRSLDGALAGLQAYATEHDKDESVALVARRIDSLREDLHDIARASARVRRRAPRGVRVDEDGVVLDEQEDGNAEPRGQGQDDEDDDHITWLDVRERSVSLGRSPVDLGPTLRARLWDRVPSVICTSATLTTATRGAEPSFHFTRARLGAPPEVEELFVPSPFDFGRRAGFYVPRDLPEPMDPRFEAAAAERIAELVAVTGGGAFVLCTAARAMRALHKALGRKLRLPLLLQGEAPKHLLLSRFRAAGNAVLVATMSFWEGVDVPGHALRLVVLDKIPFAVPTDPIVRARSERIERTGGNAFLQLSVPAAALTLKQGFGRLLRTETDAGLVALLDRRVLTKSYGRALLGSLPPAKRVHSLEEAKAFWAGLDGSFTSVVTPAVP